MGDDSTSDNLISVDITGLSIGDYDAHPGDFHTCAVTTPARANGSEWNAAGQLRDVDFGMYFTICLECLIHWKDIALVRFRG
jgi:hypothetical protein